MSDLQDESTGQVSSRTTKIGSGDWQVLFDTVANIASLDDADAVLEAICARTRAVFNADLAYVTLHDPSHGDTFVVAADGALTEELLGLRIPLGVGIGGRVAETAAVVESPAYIGDERFAHLPYVDEIFRAEGMIALIAGPILRGTDVLGVLLVGHRTPSVHSEEDLEVLRALGTLAAIALQNARSYTRILSLNKQLTDAVEELTVHENSLKAAAQLRYELSMQILAGARSHAIVETIQGATGGFLAFIDANGVCRATAGREITAQDLGLVENVSVATDYFQSSDASTVVKIMSGSAHLGYLRLTVKEMTMAVRLHIEAGAVSMALHLSAARELAAAEGRNRDELAELLIQPTADPERFQRLADFLSLRVNGPTFIAHVESDDPLANVTVAASLRRSPQVRLAGIIGQAVVVLVDAPSGADAASELLRRLSEYNVLARLGISGPATDYDEQRIHAQLARRSFDAIRALGLSTLWASPQSLGIFGLLLSSLDSVDVDEFITSKTNKLEKFDETHNAHLYATVEAYIANSGNLSRTADELGIHINTLYGRLGRLDEVLDPAWRSPHSLTQMDVAMSLARLRREVVRSSA